MDDRRFEQLARTLGGASTRRGALAALAGLGTGFGVSERAVEAGKKRKKCDPKCPAGQTCRQGACACDTGGAVCGASCCATGQRCEGGACVDPLPQCLAFGAECKNVGVPCCDGFVCGSGQVGMGDVACYVPAGGACAATAQCVYDSTCKDGVCVANPQPTPVPPAPPCIPSFPVTDDAVANGVALQQAVANAQSGDTIVLAGGDYQFDVLMVYQFGVIAVLKSLTIERCNAEAVVTMVCPAALGAVACVAAVGQNQSLSLRGIVVRALAPSSNTQYGVMVINASAVLEDVTVEVASSNAVPVYLMALNNPASVTIASDATLRTDSPSPLSSALVTLGGYQAAITCTSVPEYVGYTVSTRCSVGNGHSITGCGCP